MGVTLYSNVKNGYNLDGGYGTFYNLRRNVAKAIMGKDFYYYEKWLETDRKTDKKYLHELCEKIRSYGIALYHFVAQSDCEGYITYKECGEIYEKIKDSDLDFSFCYDYYYSPEMKEDFKKMLKECYSHRANLKWR